MSTAPQDITHLISKAELVSGVSEKTGNDWHSINIYATGDKRPVKLNDRSIFVSDLVVSHLENEQERYDNKKAQKEDFAKGLAD